MTDLIEDALEELEAIAVPITWADVERRAQTTPMLEPSPDEHRRTVTHRTVVWPVVAAAAVIAVVVGAAVLDDRDGADLVASGETTTAAPSEPPPVTSALPPDPTELNAGIWRWPTSVFGDATTVTDASTSTTWFSFQLAVDDPDAPTRWLGILPGDSPYFEDRDGPVASGRFDDVTTYAIYDARPDSNTGATWAELTRAGGGNVTVSAKGLDPQAVIRVLDELRRRAPSLSVDAVLDAVPELAVPAGLTPEWSPILPGTEAHERARPTQLAMGLSTPDGRRLDLAIEYLGLPPAVASLDMVLQLEATRIGERVEHRDDLGTGALTVGRWDLATAFILFTDTGERITVSEPDDAGARVGPPTLEFVVRHLEVLPEAELRARLAEQGVEVVDGDVTGS